MAEDPSLSAAQIVDQVDCAAACEVEEQREREREGKHRHSRHS